MRVMALDYGTKKTGLAVTDPLQIIATGLDTVPTGELESYLTKYMVAEAVCKVVIGFPVHADGNPTNLVPAIERFGKKLQKNYPSLEVVYHDEGYSSVRAREVILASGAGKKKRRDKTLVDKISAVLILQDYLKHI